MNTFKSILAGLTALAAIALFSGQANAGFSMKLVSGATTVEIDDQENDGGGDDDFNATAGAILWAGTVGDWTVTSSTGSDFGALFGNTIPDIDLSAVAGSANAGSLTIWLTMTDLTVDPLLLIGEIGGTLAAGDSLSAEFFADATNAAYGTGTQIGSTLNFGPGGAFSGSTQGLYNGGDPYSLTIKVVITYGGSGASGSSFDANLRIPEPMSAALFGSALLGLGAVRRRKKVAA